MSYSACAPSTKTTTLLIVIRYVQVLQLCWLVVGWLCLTSHRQRGYLERQTEVKNRAARLSQGTVCLFVFYVPSTARSFRDGNPILQFTVPCEGREVITPC